MNILIVSQYYYPEQFQINEIAPELVKRGHSVTVLTGLPNYPLGKIFEGYEKERRDEIVNGVRIIRVEEHPRKKGIWNLIRNYMSFARKASRKAKDLRGFDIILCYQLSPVTVLKPAIKCAKTSRAPLVAYCLDIWPESAKAHLNIPIVYSYIKRLSKKLYNACDHIAVTSRPFIEYFTSEHGYDKNKLSYIPQHASEEMLSENLVAENNGIADFMYAGNMGKGQTLEVIIQAVAEVKDLNFRVHMVGDGTQRVELEKLAKMLGVEDKVLFYGNQRREDMAKFYRKADVLLITLRGNNAVGNTMPGKLQTYMTTGKPILGAINGAASEIINEANCGKCVSAGDYKGLAKLMKDFILRPEEYDNCGRNAKRYFSAHFTLTQFCDDLEIMMEKTACKN